MNCPCVDVGVEIGVSRCALDLSWLSDESLPVAEGMRGEEAWRASR